MSIEPAKQCHTTDVEPKPGAPVGAGQPEVDALERKLGFALPQIYRDELLWMGREALPGILQIAPVQLSLMRLQVELRAPQPPHYRGETLTATPTSRWAFCFVARIWPVRGSSNCRFVAAGRWLMACVSIYCIDILSEW